MSRARIGCDGHIEISDLAALRDGLLDRLLDELRADPSIEGVSLVGSFGTGTADAWSDVDFLIMMADEEIPRFVSQPAARPWTRAPRVKTAPHNAPAGAMQVNATFVVAGLPFWVDFNVYPSSRTGWTKDGKVVFERREIPATQLSFGELASSEPRHPPQPASGDEIQMRNLALVPIAAKFVARGATGDACRMIAMLGGDPRYQDPSQERQLAALRAIAATLSDPAWPWLAQAVAEFLDLAQTTLSRERCR